MRRGTLPPVSFADFFLGISYGQSSLHTFASAMPETHQACSVPEMSMPPFPPFYFPSILLGFGQKTQLLLLFVIFYILYSNDKFFACLFSLVTLKTVHLLNVSICIWNLWKGGFKNCSLEAWITENIKSTPFPISLVSSAPFKNQQIQVVVRKMYMFFKSHKGKFRDYTEAS